MSKVPEGATHEWQSCDWRQYAKRSGNGWAVWQDDHWSWVGDDLRGKMVPLAETETRYKCGTAEGTFTLEQLKSAGWTVQNISDFCIAVTVPKAPSAAEERLHKIRNACSTINSKVEQYNVSIDCSAAMRAVIEAMIDAGYHK
jgi:hypothetical protein